jgi:hypothetical protein
MVHILISVVFLFTRRCDISLYCCEVSLPFFTLMVHYGSFIVYGFKGFQCGAKSLDNYLELILNVIIWSYGLLICIK